MKKLIVLAALFTTVYATNVNAQQVNSGAQQGSSEATAAMNERVKQTKALLVEKAKVLVSNDTGLMHMAAAYKKPIVSLWGNTSPEMGMFPYYGSNNLKTIVDPRSTIVEHPHLSCHPCSKLGYRKCPRGHFKCMQVLDMHKVSTSVKNYWNITQR
jgi:ADP-heptose:LPS heptosyltransferase